MKHAVLVSAFVLIAPAAFATLSNPIRLVPSPSGSLHWRTSFGRELEWDWPAGAVSAKLSIRGGSGLTEFVYTRPLASHVLTVPTSDADEDVCDFRLEFYAEANAGGSPLESETLVANGIGLVRGVNGSAVALRPDGAANRGWKRAGSVSAVFPIPADAEEMKCDGIDVPYAFAPGWHIWSGENFEGDHNWLLLAGGVTYAVLLHGGLPGFLLILK